MEEPKPTEGEPVLNRRLSPIAPFSFWNLPKRDRNWAFGYVAFGTFFTVLGFAIKIGSSGSSEASTTSMFYILLGALILLTAGYLVLQARIAQVEKQLREGVNVDLQVTFEPAPRPPDERFATKTSEQKIIDRRAREWKKPN